MDNIRFVIDDARLLLQVLPPECLDTIYILFPSPWPKSRHHKRRIETIGLILRVLKCGGQLILATDIAEYAQCMHDTLQSCPEFQLSMGQRTHLYERPQIGT